MLDNTKKQLLGNASREAQVQISPPNFRQASIKLVGTAPYVQNKMSQRAKDAMEEAQKSGQQARSKRKREPKDFEAVWKGALHVSKDGWYGIPCSSIRAAMISACRTVGFKMTIAKLSLFVIPDGFDADDGQPLVKINGNPRCFKMGVKLANGSADIAARPMFEEWSATPVLQWDNDAFSVSDVINLISRAGKQVGIGAGRPDSRESAGMGFGTFRVEMG